MKVAVVIPTYKEAGAIGALLDELQRVFASAPQHTFEILVVDAASPDGTADIVREKASSTSNIHLIEEAKKEGIAPAYVRGFSHAIHSLHADALVEFDGDGQHDPKDIPRLIEKLDEGYDYVVGSRYVDGGSIPTEWAPHRKLLSRFGSLYARILLELPVHDATSGLKATRSDAPGLRELFVPSVLLTRDYAYKLQFLHALHSAGARIAEIPIVFRTREHDASKSTWRDIFESLRVTGILRLRTFRSWRLIRVVAVGGVGFLIQTSIFHTLGIWFAVVLPSTAVLIGGEAAILSNFFLNGRFSFGDRDVSHTSLLARLARFHLVSLGSIATQWVLVRTAEVIFGHTASVLWIAYLSGIAIGLLINYTGYYFWVWRDAKYARKKAS